jgi:hypothetical protein
MDKEYSRPGEAKRYVEGHGSLDFDPCEFEFPQVGFADSSRDSKRYEDFL